MSNTLKPFHFALNSFHNVSMYKQPLIQDAKKLIYEVEDITKDIEENELMLRVCQEVALNEEEKGLNIDAFELLDKAQLAQERVKMLKAKKNQIINTLKQRRKSLDQVKRQNTPNRVRPLGHLKNVL